MNADDEPCGTFDTLLISATDISYDDVFPLARQFHAVAVPAHIDKSTTSLISQLGMVPPWSTFRLAEVKHWGQLPQLIAEQPYLQRCSFLHSSDAHSLAALQQPLHQLEAAERTGEAVFDALWRLQYGE